MKFGHRKANEVEYTQGSIWACGLVMVLYILDMVKFEQSKYCKELSKRGKHHAAGQFLLRWALGEEAYGKADFAQNEHGKPYIVGTPIHYNISHSGQYVVLVTANSEVGVDIQEKKSLCKEAVAKRFFSEKEWKAISKYGSEEEKKDLFYHIWCRKEAYGKFLGVGLNQQVLDTNVLSEVPDKSCVCEEGREEALQEIINFADCKFHDLETIDGYQISICSRKGEHIEKIIRVFEGL